MDSIFLQRNGVSTILRADHFGSQPSFLPIETEAVWEISEHRFAFIEVEPERAGTAKHLIFVDDLDALVAEIAERGLDPAKRETLSNGVRKAAYRDRDGNQIEFGGAPLVANR
jgi:catechol 2,3-dioxygenase-like lactoylglutathione lyase family enzyme